MFQSYAPLAISHRECIGGGGQLLPPLVHSLREIDKIRWLTTPIPNKLLWSNLRYHLSTSYSTFWEKIRAIQQCWLISEQEVTSAENGLLQLVVWHHMQEMMSTYTSMMFPPNYGTHNYVEVTCIRYSTPNTQPNLSIRIPVLIALLLWLETRQ